MSPFALSIQSGVPSSPGSGLVAFYARGTNLYYLNASGVEAQLATGAGTLENGTWSADLGPSGTAERADGVIYQNTSGRKRRVAVMFLGVITNPLQVTLFADPATPPTLFLVANLIGVNSVTAAHVLTCYMEVPNNWYYKSVISTVGSIQKWRELDE